MWVNKLHLHFTFYTVRFGVPGVFGVPVFLAFPVFRGVPVFLVLVHAALECKSSK